MLNILLLRALQCQVGKFESVELYLRSIESSQMKTMPKSSLKFMIKFFLAVPLIFFVLTNIIDGQPFATRTGDKLILDNGVVQRVIQFGSADHGIVSESYLLRKTGDEFLSPDSEDFYFEADGKPVTALDKWKLLSVRIVGDENRGSGAMVVIEHPESKIRISVTYMLYPSCH